MATRAKTATSTSKLTTNATTTPLDTSLLLLSPLLDTKLVSTAMPLVVVGSSVEVVSGLFGWFEFPFWASCGS
jgi:hypothetical protein